MAIKINLKKNDETKNGFVGFSFTTFFWRLFVPVLRKDNKTFLKHFFYMVSNFWTISFYS